MLPLNRIGAARGEREATLSDIWTAIEAQQAALLAALSDIDAKLEVQATGQAALAAALVALNNSVATMAGYIGDPASTVCGTPENETLCAIFRALTEDEEEEGPPALCPGFPDPDGVWYRNLPWTQDDPPITGFGGNWHTTYTPTGIPTLLYIDVIQPYPEFPEYSYHAIRTTMDLTNICIAWQRPDTNYIVSTAKYNAVDNTLITIDDVWSSNAEPGPGSNDFIFDADQYLVVYAHRVGGTLSTEPLAELWIMEGVLG